MLYNKDWDKPAKKLEMWTLPHLIAWLETKPADGFYDYCDSRHCLMCQYVQDNLGGRVWANSMCVTRTGITSWPTKYTLPPLFDRIARGGNGTYGDALWLARAYQSQA